jgi:hypothetical protein
MQRSAQHHAVGSPLQDTPELNSLAPIVHTYDRPSRPHMEAAMVGQRNDITRLPIDKRPITSWIGRGHPWRG